MIDGNERVSLLVDFDSNLVELVIKCGKLLRNGRSLRFKMSQFFSVLLVSQSQLVSPFLFKSESL